MSEQPKPLILIVEDDKDVAKLIATQLEEAGLETQIFHRASNALKFLERDFANLMLLDIGLPDASGFSFLAELRQRDITVPTIILTGHGSEVDKVKGLESGADDYVTKPFSFPELIARIHAVLRRAETSKDNFITPAVSISEVDFDFCGAKVSPHRMLMLFPGGHEMSIGRKELGILSFLHQNIGQVVTRKSLIHAVWGPHADLKSRSLDQYIVKIRDNFDYHKADAEGFRTIHGVGYILEDPARPRRD